MLTKNEDCIKKLYANLCSYIPNFKIGDSRAHVIKQKQNKQQANKTTTTTTTMGNTGAKDLNRDKGRGRET